ncbi:unnamed protein product [marine sediment metagenome]|uniref:Uncharacterized protein n=1 Tax=marine sediment metagenome TaxID=412755 RepID=X1IA52_9ZZZZ
MPIEKDIIEKIKRFTFNKNLLEFIDRAKYLEERLKEGENILVKLDEHKLSGIEFIYLELHKTEGKPEKVVSLNCLGIRYKSDFFKDYKPLPESQRA